MTIDPLAEKYYGWSPYAYCANNPLRFVDPDGKKIVVGSFLGRLLAFCGVDNYEKKVQLQIENLRSMDVRLEKSIDYLQESEKIVYINDVPKSNKNRGNFTRPETNNLKVKQGSSVGYDVDNESTNQGGKRPSIIGLAHELGHAENYMKGDAVKYDKENAKKE